MRNNPAALLLQPKGRDFFQLEMFGIIQSPRPGAQALTWCKSPVGRAGRMIPHSGAGSGLVGRGCRHWGHCTSPPCSTSSSRCLSWDREPGSGLQGLAGTPVSARTGHCHKGRSFGMQFLWQGTHRAQKLLIVLLPASSKLQNRQKMI